MMVLVLAFRGLLTLTTITLIIFSKANANPTDYGRPTAVVKPPISFNLSNALQQPPPNLRLLAQLEAEDEDLTPYLPPVLPDDFVTRSHASARPIQSPQTTPSSLSHYTETSSPLPARGVLLDHYDHKKAALSEVCGAPAAAALVEYAKFHARVLHGEEKPRYLIAVPVEAGLADRMTGVISLFWLAFFSRNAFQIGAYHKLPRFEAAYDYVFVNWTRSPRDDEDKYTSPAMYTYKDIRDYKGLRRYEDNVIDTSKFTLEYLINQDKRIQQLYQFSDLIQQYPTSDRAYPHEQYIFSSSNRGGIHYLFQNEFHKKHLEEELQLHPMKAFRCAYHFLFQNNDKVHDAIHQVDPLYTLERASLYSVYRQRSDLLGKSEMVHMTPPPRRKRSRIAPTPQPTSIQMPPKLKIGIGIRVGDQAFDPDQDNQVMLDSFSGYLNCANHLTNSLPKDLFAKLKVQQSLHHNLTLPTDDEEAYPILWYVMSESKHLRELIHKRYGEKVITDYQTIYFHGDCHSKTHGGCHQEKLDHAIIHAAAQLTLFSLCDVHIVSESGFPRISAEVAKEPHLMFKLSMHRQTKDLEKVCHLENPIEYEKIQSIGCGI